MHNEAQIQEKVCLRCEAPKHLTEYNKNRKSIDGLQSYCRGCQKEAHANYRQTFAGREAGRTASAKRRSAKLGLGPSEQVPYREIWNHQDGKCAYCLTPLLGEAHVDHVIPISLGGSLGMGNLVVSCVQCNIRKGDSLWIPKIPPYGTNQSPDAAPDYEVFEATPGRKRRTRKPKASTAAQRKLDAEPKLQCPKCGIDKPASFFVKGERWCRKCIYNFNGIDWNDQGNA